MKVQAFRVKEKFIAGQNLLKFHMRPPSRKGCFDLGKPRNSHMQHCSVDEQLEAHGAPLLPKICPEQKIIGNLIYLKQFYAGNIANGKDRSRNLPKQQKSIRIRRTGFVLQQDLFWFPLLKDLMSAMIKVKLSNTRLWSSSSKANHSFTQSERLSDCEHHLVPGFGHILLSWSCSSQQDQYYHSKSSLM